MPTVKRQKIVNAIVACCGLIRTSNGYKTNAGATVGDWVQNWQEDELPAISVCDLDEEVQEDMTNEAFDIYRLSVSIRAHFPADIRPVAAREHIADILKALGTNPRLSDGTSNQALKVEIGKTGFVQSEESFEIAGAFIDLMVYYHTPKWSYY